MEPQCRATETSEWRVIRGRTMVGKLEETYWSNFWDGRKREKKKKQQREGTTDNERKKGRGG